MIHSLKIWINILMRLYLAKRHLRLEKMTGAFLLGDLLLLREYDPYCKKLFSGKNYRQKGHVYTAAF